MRVKTFSILMAVAIATFIMTGVAWADDEDSECSFAALKGLWECTFSGFIQTDGPSVPIIATGVFRSLGGAEYFTVEPRTVLAGKDAFLESLSCKLDNPALDPDVCGGEAGCSIIGSDREEAFRYALVTPNKVIFNGIAPEYIIVSGTCERIKTDDDDEDGEDDD